MLTSLPTNSNPKALPLSRIGHQFTITSRNVEGESRREAHVATEFIPAGNAVKQSADLTPGGQSYKRLRKPAATKLPR